MENKTPLDKKIKVKRKNDFESVNPSYIYVEDVKSSLSNLKKRLKEELVQENVWDEESMGIIDNKIDLVFDEVIGKGLLEDDNDTK